MGRAVLGLRPSPSTTRVPAVIDLRPEAPASRDEDGEPSSARPGLRRALLWYAVSRVVVVLATLPSIVSGDPGRGPWPTITGGDSVARALARWDGAWYLWVAGRGYPSSHDFVHHLSDVAFFPLYPALIKTVSTVTRISPIYVALTISIVFGAIATAFVWLVICKVADPGTAGRAALLFVFFPGSFVLSMAYAEPLMIAASAACVYFMLDRRWVLAGLAGAVATASRPNALAVVATAAIIAAVALYRRRDRAAVLTPTIAMGGIGAFFLYLWIHTGRASAWFISEREMWHDHVSVAVPVFQRVAGVLTRWPLSLESGRLNDLIAVGGFVIVGFGLWATWRSRWPLVVRVYTAAALIIPSLSIAVGPRPRMLFAAFPVAGMVAQSQRWYRVLLWGSVIGLVVLTHIVSSSLAATP
jgi:hypothetical protein